MGFTLISIAIGAMALLLILLFSANVAGWFVWGIYVIMSLFFFIKSFTEYKSLRKGEPKRVTDIIGIASFPFTTSTMGIALIIFLFFDINKLHLLWIYPIVALIFDFTIGKRAENKVLEKTKKDKKKKSKTSHNKVYEIKNKSPINFKNTNKAG